MPNKVDIVNNQPGADADEVFEALHRLMHHVRNGQFKALRDEGIDLAHMEAKALGFFARNPLATQGDLVNHAGRDKAQIARIIANLKDKKLLEAQENDEDRRSVRLQLTTAGQKLWQTMRRRSQRMQSKMLDALTPAELRQLVKILRKIKSRAERESL